MADQPDAETPLELNPKDLDAPSLKTIHHLLERCIYYQRRLDSATLYLTDPQIIRRTLVVITDLRTYRRCLLEHLCSKLTPEVYKESIRIVEKAMLTIAVSTDQICLIAGKECIF